MLGTCGLSRIARAYTLAVIVGGVASIAWMLPRIAPANVGPALIAGALAAVLQSLSISGPTDRSSYNLGFILYAAVAIALGAPEAVIVVVVASVSEWIVHDLRWHVAMFNIATVSICLVVGETIAQSLGSLMASGGSASTVPMLVAGAAFLLVDHVLVGCLICVTNGTRLRDSGVFAPLTLAIDGSLLGLGAFVGLTWDTDPFAAIFAIAPGYLLYRALSIPTLAREAMTDPKTGLANSRYFAEVLDREICRSQRNRGDLTVVVADLDLLRNINNTYGHLAGDVVLIGVAGVLRDLTRSYDTVARIGGEEFAILMTETTAEEAVPRIESIREAIEAEEFEVTSSPDPIRTTMSFGISQWMGGDEVGRQMVHAADLALYRAKLEGRNRIRVASPDDAESVAPSTLLDHIAQVPPAFAEYAEAHAAASLGSRDA